MTTRIIVMAAVCSLMGCAALLVDDRRALADRDDAACAAGGHAWPSAAYERCRYELAERRHQRDWERLRMIEPRRPDQGVTVPREPYQPLSRTRFRCTERHDDAGMRWIECDA